MSGGVAFCPEYLDNRGPTVYLRSHGLVVQQRPLVVACPGRGAFHAGSVAGSLEEVVLVGDCTGLQELLDTQSHCKARPRGLQNVL
jgi:hypothetical protein